MGGCRGKSNGKDGKPGAARVIKGRTEEGMYYWCQKEIKNENLNKGALARRERER